MGGGADLSKPAVKVYATFEDARMPLAELPGYARRAESAGFDGLLVPEATHDPFIASTIAVANTSRIEVATSVALAFVRSPVAVAYAAWDLQALSGGRFTLGLGSQIRANIEGRFGLPWSAPVTRMRDYIGALRAAWDCWQNGTPLSFESENYRLDRMQPFFSPGPLDCGPPPVMLGSVRPAMSALAGELADLFVTHPTNSDPRFLRERLIPTLDSAATQGQPGIIAGAFVATGRNEHAVEAERERIRTYMGFLYSTPHYWPALEMRGLEELGMRLKSLAAAGDWESMTAAIDDDLMAELVVAAPYDTAAGAVLSWYGELVTAVCLRLPQDPADDGPLAEMVAELRGADPV